jgi:hypothetical protein
MLRVLFQDLKDRLREALSCFGRQLASEFYRLMVLANAHRLILQLRPGALFRGSNTRAVQPPGLSETFPSLDETRRECPVAKFK